jgi:hypothetical protein
MSEDSVENKINEYYRLKSRYEEENQKNKNKIRNNKELSLKEKKQEFQQLKPKCVNCGKPGGTTFASVINKNNNISDQFRELRAFCKAVEPCGLNINIAVGNFDNINIFLKEIQDEIDDYKKQIINDKNKLLFGLLTTKKALENFDIQKEGITDFTNLLQVYLEDYIKITDNAEEKQRLGQELEKSYLDIQEIKIAISNFDRTNDVQYIRDAVNIYVTNLQPKLAAILKLKYKENKIWYDDNNETYHLIQNKYTIKDLEINIAKYETVVFDTSLQGSSIPREPKKRSLIIESSTPVEEDIIGKPTFNEDDSVSWSNKNYQMLWDKMNNKLQNALLSDREWLQEFMDSCVKARLENKPCVFTSPSNLIFPPQILDDETYDFGNSFYNDFFNKLGVGFHNRLLKLFITEKDGSKNYKPLENEIQRMLIQELEFGKGYLEMLPIKPINR